MVSGAKAVKGLLAAFRAIRARRKRAICYRKGHRTTVWDRERNVYTCPRCGERFV